MQLTGLDRLFWVLSFAEHCVLLAVLLYRHRARTFPVFTAFVLMNVLRTIVLYFTFRFGSPHAYFYTYWTLAIVDVALQCTIIYELATHVFQPLGVWAPDVRRSFVALIGVSLLFALALTWLAAPATRTLRSAIVIRGDLFSSALMSELFVAMIALSVTLGLPWRTHVARLAQGFGIYSLYGILTDAGHSYFGNATYQVLSRLQIGLYVIVLGYWIVTLTMKEPEPRRIPAELHDELRSLQRRAALLLSSLRTTGSAS